MASETNNHIENYATLANGCLIYDCSSHCGGQQPNNLLTSVHKNLWLTPDPPPQYFVLDLSELIKKPDLINVFGFYCWHDYSTNPAQIQLMVSADGRKFVSLGVYECEIVAGWQYFKFSPVPIAKAQLFKVVILKNGGDEQTYMNQIIIGYQQLQHTESELEKLLPPQPKPQVQKSGGDSMRLTSTEKTMKQLVEKVRVLEDQNQGLRKELMKVSNTVLSMQGTISMLVKNMEKMNRLIESMNRMPTVPTVPVQTYQPSESKQLLDNFITQLGDKTESYQTYRQNSQPQTALLKEMEIIPAKQRQKSSTNFIKQVSGNSQYEKGYRHKHGIEGSSQNSSGRQQPNKIEQKLNQNKKRRVRALLESLQQKMLQKQKIQQKLQKSRGRRSRSSQESEND